MESHSLYSTPKMTPNPKLQNLHPEHPSSVTPQQRRRAGRQSVDPGSGLDSHGLGRDHDT